VVNRGAIVDEHLQTSNEFVYAMGEIAERNGMLFGITAGAEEQAVVLAEYLNGSTTSNYESTLSMNILKVHGIELCSIGMVETPSIIRITKKLFFWTKIENIIRSVLYIRIAWLEQS